MEMDLSGSAGTHGTPLAECLKRMFGFYVKSAFVVHKFRHQWRQPLDPAVLVRWIEKQHVKTHISRGPRGGEFYRIRTHNLQTRVGPQQAGIGLQRSEHRRRIVDHHHTCRTA